MKENIKNLKPIKELNNKDLLAEKRNIDKIIEKKKSRGKLFSVKYNNLERLGKQRQVNLIFHQSKKSKIFLKNKAFKIRFINLKLRLMNLKLNMKKKL